MHLPFTLLLFRFHESNALKKITDEMAATTSKLGIVLPQKKILQPGEYAAKLDLSGHVMVMEKDRVEFALLRLPNGFVEGEAVSGVPIKPRGTNGAMHEQHCSM